MALPVDGLPTPEPITAPFEPPRNRQRVPLEDWSRGGIGIQDASAGINVYDWRGYADMDTSELFLGVPGVVAFTSVFQFPRPVVEIAFAFDTNMNPVIGWREDDGSSWFRWFDPTTPGFESIELAAGSYSVRIALDDVRDIQALSGVTDTVIAYMREGTVFYRLLRDRFEDEHEFSDDHDNRQLGQIGMNELLRFQFQLEARHDPTIATSIPPDEP